MNSALRAEPDAVGVGAELLDQLELVGLVGEPLAGLDEARLAPDEAVVALHLLAHPTLDLLEIVGRQRARQIEVVVEAGRDRRADRDFAVGEELQDDLREHVGGGVAHPPQPLLGVNLVGADNRRAGGFLFDLLLRHPSLPLRRSQACGRKSGRCVWWWAILDLNQ